MKKKIIILVGICLLLTIFTIYNKSQKLDVTETYKDKEAISFYVANENGEYEKRSGFFPSSGYVVNTDKSYCVNGSTISSKTATCNLGDLNEDGKVNTADANIVLRLASGTLDNNFIYQNCGDVDGDGDITDDDATMISSYAAKYITTFTKGEPLTKIKYIKTYTNMKTADDCFLYFEVKKPTLAETIISLTEERDETKAWQVINENGYRYEGDSTTENNLCLDEKCSVPYRIIGVFETPYDGDGDGIVEDGETDYLVKAVRTTQQTTTQYWNSTKTGTNYNDWTTASLQKALNATSGTDEVNVYANMSDAVKNKIAKARWYLGNVVYGSSGDTAASAYANERSSSIYDGNYEYYDNYIGLIYPSDYGYAPLTSSCRNYVLYSYSICKTNNWLFSENYYWTISPSSFDSSTAMRVNSAGYVGNDSVSYAFGVRESFYLKPEVMASGDGSIENPYVLKE